MRTENYRSIMLPWSTILFASVLLLIAIAVSAILSITFGIGVGQTFGPVVAWLGVVYTYHRWNAGNTDTENSENDTNSADSPGPDVEPQSRAYSPGHDPETTDSDSDTDGDSHSNSERSDTDTGRQSSLRRSNEDILEETETKLGDHITFYDDSTIDLHADDLDLYNQMMLYVVAKRLAYEDDLIDEPAVTVTDIRDEFDYNKIEIMLFLRKARSWLVSATEQAPVVGTIDYQELDEVAVTVNTRSLSEIADWILEDDQPHPHDVAYGIGNAGTALSVADNQYEKAKEEEAADAYSADADIHYSQVRQKVQRACIDAAEYPVMFERDMAWTEFTEYAEALLDFMDDGHPGKISHCLPEMQRYRQQMKETADEAAYL